MHPTDAQTGPGAGTLDAGAGGPLAAARPPIRWLPTLLLGALLTVLNVIWMTSMQVMWNQGAATLLSLYFNAVCTLVLVILANVPLRRFRPRLALSAQEMLVLFVMVGMGTGTGLMGELLISTLAFPHHFQSTDSRWAASLLPHLSRYFTVADPQAGEAYYVGSRHPWSWAMLRPWLAPFLGWGVFLAAMTWTGIALSGLVHNQLRHQERMPFPLTQIPVMMTAPRVPLARSPLFWIGFALAGSVDVLNALHRVDPTIPMLWLKLRFVSLPGLDRPWSALNPITYSLNPFLIGMEYFLPLDLLFSLVLFYWVGRLQGVLLAWAGAPDTSLYTWLAAPYMREQAVGALLAFLLFSFWAGRGRWRESWERFPPVLPRAWCTRGSVVGALAMVAILAASGMPARLALLFVALYLALLMSLSRIRAQYGPPSADLFVGAPGPVLYSLLGRDGLGSQGLASLASTHWLGRSYAPNPVPQTLEGMVLIGRERSPRRLVLCLLLAAMVGYAAAFGTALALGFHFGHMSGKTSITQYFVGNEAFAVFSQRLSDPVGGTHWDSLAAVALGCGVTILLQGLRASHPGFPIHPVGYAVAGAYTSAFIWSTALITWGVKLLLLRYGGLRGYQRAAPFFLGLLLGEFVLGSLISLVGVLIGTELYVFWPY